jgi:hypothetical protein
MDRRQIMAREVSMPYVKAVSRATPNVEVSPGMAPKMMPSNTDPKRTARLIGSAASEKPISMKDPIRSRINMTTGAPDASL